MQTLGVYQKSSLGAASSLKRWPVSTPSLVAGSASTRPQLRHAVLLNAQGNGDRARILTADIKSTQSVAALAELVQENDSHMNFIHTSATIVHAAQLTSRSSSSSSSSSSKQDIKALMGSWADIAQRQLPNFDARATANTAYALAKLHQLSPADSQLVSAVCKLSKGQLADMNPQQLANTIWAFAVLGHMPGAAWAHAFEAASSQQLEHFTAQGLGNMAYAAGKLKPLMSSQWVEALVARSSAVLPNAQAQELIMTAYGLALLRHFPGRAWLAALYAKLTLCVKALDAQQVSSLCYSIALLRQVQPFEDTAGLEAALLSRARALLGSCDAQQLATIIIAAQHLAARPSQPWLKQAARQLLGLLPSLGPDYAASSLLALAEQQCELSKAEVAAFLQHSKNHLGGHSSEALASLTLALAYYGHKPDAAWVETFQATSLPLLASCSAPDLANMMFGLARLKVIPNRTWMAALLAASQANMAGCGPAHLARLIFGVAQVGTKPDAAWRAAYCSASLACSAAHDREDVAKAWTAAARLGPEALEPQWYAAMTDVAVARLGSMRPTQQIQVLRAWANLGLTPPEAALDAFAAAVRSEGNQLDEEQLMRLQFALRRLHKSAAWVRTRIRELKEAREAAAVQQEEPGAGTRPITLADLVRNLAGCVDEGALVAELLTRYQARLAQLSGAELVDLLAALSQGGARRLPRAWVVEFWRRSGPQLGKLSGDETRALLRAVAGLRLTPQRWWLAKLLTATKKGMSSYHGGVVAGLVLSMAELGLAPPADWRAAFLRQLSRGLQAYRAGQLTGSLWGLAQLGVRLEAGLLQQYTAALAPLLGNLTQEQTGEVVRALEVYAAQQDAPRELHALAEGARRRLEEGVFYSPAAEGAAVQAA